MLFSSVVYGLYIFFLLLIKKEITLTFLIFTYSRLLNKLTLMTAEN